MFFTKQLSLMIISMCNYIASRHFCTLLMLQSFKIVLPTFLDSITLFGVGIGECTLQGGCILLKKKTVYY